MSKVFIVGYARTPFGAFQGALASVPAPRLGAEVIKAALRKSQVKPESVSEVIMGNVLTAGEGQAPARQASLYAGIPNSVPCMTVNKVCGSGMKAIMLGSQSIRLGESEIVVAGGMENMSMAPYLLHDARAGLRMGNRPFVDSMVNDGLWDPYNDQHMGNCAELCAREKGFSREEQDQYAIDSFKRAQEAQKQNRFAPEIQPVTVASRKKEIVVEHDEGPSKVKFEKIPQLKPVFDKGGTVTAANASTINDGAAAVVLASEEACQKHGLKPLARLASYGVYAHKPEWFTTAPTGAMKAALKQAGWEAAEVDLVEVNEAFAVVALSAARDLAIPHDRMNIWGGAISLGHPIGASGARIVLTLVNQMESLGKTRGLAGICIGGGEATALGLERTV